MGASVGASPNLRHWDEYLQGPPEEGDVHLDRPISSGYSGVPRPFPGTFGYLFRFAAEDGIL
jgi:hypothetical protein